MRDRENKRKLKKIFWTTWLFLGLALLSAAKSEAANMFFEKFNQKGCLEEAGSMEESASANWWVNSGGKMCFKRGIGMTIQKNLPRNSRWNKLYRQTNPEDTDKGKHPQNIFRLITKSKWQNFSQEAYFKIRRFNLSKSKNRNASNGLLLMSRYQDSDNLYYAGVRVDGYAVIKKKINGEYFEMAYNRYYGTKKYSRRDKNRSHFLPRNKWIALKTEVRNTPEGKVEIKLYIKQKREWVLAAEGLDEPGKYGGEVLDSQGYAGIRTDFMDVEFDKYRMADL